MTLHTKYLSAPGVNPALGLIVAVNFLAGISDAVAAEKNYTRPPFAAFSSQMRDGLTGGGKYEKPVWNLHDALKLPEWLSLSVEQRTRYETMDGSFRADSKGGDQQIPLQLDVALEARLGGWRLGGEFLEPVNLDLIRVPALIILR